jgi:hypothetical protein
MTHKEKLEICEMINRNKHKIIRLENALRDDKLTTQEFQFVTESRPASVLVPFPICVIRLFSMCHCYSLVIV